MPGVMSKANSRQNSHNKAKYDRQRHKTAANKQKHIDAQKKFQERKRNEKEGVA